MALLGDTIETPELLKISGNLSSITFSDYQKCYMMLVVESFRNSKTLAKVEASAKKILNYMNKGLATDMGVTMIVSPADSSNFTLGKLVTFNLVDEAEIQFSSQLIYPHYVCTGEGTAPDDFKCYIDHGPCYGHVQTIPNNKEYRCPICGSIVIPVFDIHKYYKDKKNNIEKKEEAII